jgi:ribose transport system substrate-binding protein
MNRSRKLSFLCVSLTSAGLILGSLSSRVVAQTVAPATPTETPTNPLTTTQLSEIATVLGNAVRGKGDPANTDLAIVANALSPFWTAGQIGSQRAASELGISVIFNAPIKPGDIAAQRNMVDSFIKDGYKGLAFSAIDSASIEPAIQTGIAQGIHFVAIDSDAPKADRLVYIGTNNYNAGVTAGKAVLQALGQQGGKVVGLVGTPTAQNAADRIRGIQDTLKGTNVTLETIMVDDLDPLKAENNASQALAQYPDLAAFVTLYSYDGAAAGEALKVANLVGKVKIIAFDLEPQTITLLKQGVIAAAIGQRPYFMGYLSVYALYAAITLGPETTLQLLSPYVSGPNKDVIDTGVDIVTVDTLPAYSQYLNSIGINSQ